MVAKGPLVLPSWQFPPSPTNGNDVPHHQPSPDLVSLVENYQTETIPLASAGDKLAAGVGQSFGFHASSIAVRNLGTVDLVVTNAPANAQPEGLVGPGTAIVPPGVLVVLNMPGTKHAFYGRPGELVEVTRYRDLQAPFMASTLGDWFVVNQPVPISGVLYTTPWGTRATYGGFTARETAGLSPVAFQLVDGAGKILADVNLNANGSTEEDTTMILCADPTISMVFIGGGGVLRFSLRCR